jgi:uncharacterized protein YigA (DUF484 family)
MPEKLPKSEIAKLTKDMVLDYLAAHPDFLKQHPELLEKLQAPVVHHGSNIVDMQHFMVGNLQKKLQTISSKYDGLITSSRDNMSTLHQVHTAIVDLVKARDLEHLLEIITLDLVHLFGVDVVRLALESEAAELYESAYSEHNYSGVSFIDIGTTALAIGKDKPALLAPDASGSYVHGFEQVFVDCSGLIESFAFIKLNLAQTGRQAILAFGVRHKDRFSPSQGTELLAFLGRVVEACLDRHLTHSGIAEMI